MTGRMWSIRWVKSFCLRGTKVSIYKTLQCVLTAASLIAAPMAANAECFTQAEWQAAHVQLMQRTLQVAALECANVPGHSYSDQYNAFIARFSDRLRVDGVVFRQHFHRVYGAGADNHMDQFVTRLVNDASAKSMNSVTYCADPTTAQMFKAALAVNVGQFEQVALTAVPDDEIGVECPARTVGVRVSAHKSTKHHPHKKPLKKVADAN
jgi:hypothetical protein